MSSPETEVLIFKSAIPDEFARAAAKLKAAGIAFSVHDQVEGTWETPHRTGWILVKRRDEYAAEQCVNAISSEAIVTENISVLQSPNGRDIHFTKWCALAGIILAAILLVILNSL